LSLSDASGGSADAAGLDRNGRLASRWRLGSFIAIGSREEEVRDLCDMMTLDAETSRHPTPTA
jgi:hypothetical protein